MECLRLLLSTAVIIYDYKQHSSDTHLMSVAVYTKQALKADYVVLDH